MSKSWLPYIALIVVNFLYGANYTVAKTIMPGLIQPFGFIFIRVVITSILLHLTSLFVFREKIAWKDVPHFILCGLLGVTINQLFFFKGLSMTSRITASLIMITTPILVLTFSAFAGKERMSWQKAVGVILGAVGASWLIAGKRIGVIESDSVGNLYVFLNAASFAGYLVTVKSLMNRYHPLTVLKWVFTFGALFVIPFGWGEFQQVEWASFNSGAWLALLYVVLLNTYVAYGLNLYALSKLNPSVVGIFIYSQPVFATIIAMLFAGEYITGNLFVAATLIFGGVYLVNRKPRAV